MTLKVLETKTSGCRRTEAEDQVEAREKAEPDGAKGWRDESQTTARKSMVKAER